MNLITNKDGIYSPLGKNNLIIIEQMVLEQPDLRLQEKIMKWDSFPRCQQQNNFQLDSTFVKISNKINPSKHTNNTGTHEDLSQLFGKEEAFLRTWKTQKTQRMCR